MLFNLLEKKFCSQIVFVFLGDGSFILTFDNQAPLEVKLPLLCLNILQ